METQLSTPKFPLLLSFILIVVAIIELIVYGVLVSVPMVWAPLLFAGFYVTYLALFRKDALPLIFVVFFLTAHHTLFWNFHSDLPIALLFLIIFLVTSGIMWILLHFATHLLSEHHLAYSLISGFMMAQLLTLYAIMAKDWSIRFEVASYIATVFSYTFWRFACLSADLLLNWKNFRHIATVVAILILAIIVGSPNATV